MCVGNDDVVVLVVIIIVLVARPLSFGCVVSMVVSGPEMMVMVGMWRSVVDYSR